MEQSIKMYVCQYCGKEVAITLLDPEILDLEVCPQCFEDLQLYGEVKSTQKYRQAESLE